MSQNPTHHRILIFLERPEKPAFFPRMRYVCAYLAREGFEVDVAAENGPGLSMFDPAVNIFPIDYIKNKGRKGTLEWAVKAALTLICDYKDRYFYRKSKALWQGRKYDAVLASSCYTFPLPAAARAASELGVPFIADLRDIAEQAGDDFYILSHKPKGLLGRLIAGLHRKISISRRNRALRAAGAVTTVSPWHVGVISRINPNTRLVYNGFDEQLFKPAAAKTETFNLSYFGRIYNDGLRNPRPLFEALALLLSKLGAEDSASVRVRWFTDAPSRKVIEEYAARYGSSANMLYRDFIPPAELPAELAASSVALVINASDGGTRYRGIMTTKFFEAVGMNRPLLSLPDNGDDLSRLVRESGAGLGSSDPEEICGFLLQKFSEWKASGLTAGTVPENVRMGFSRRVGAEIFIKLLVVSY